MEQTKQVTVKGFFDREDVKKKFNELLGKRAASFMTSVLQVVAQNQLLAKADPASIYQASAVAATLDLPINQNLGFAYIVPYNTKQSDGSYKQVAQFQMGYKGFIQLAQRSGQFKELDSKPVYEGQYMEDESMKGFHFEWKNKKSDILIGFVAWFKLLNGYEAMYFMTVEQLKRHGAKYSKTFTNKNSLWANDFESMASKTVIKLLLSRFAPLSVEMQRAVISDQALINDADTIDVTYIDNSEVEVDKESERVRLMIEDAKVVKDLINIKAHVTPELSDLYETKFAELSEKEV